MKKIFIVQNTMLRAKQWDTLVFEVHAETWSSIEIVIEWGGKKTTRRIEADYYDIEQEPWIYTYTVNIITPKKVIKGDPQDLIIT